MKTNSKSIEQLENDYWKDEIIFPSNLVINCHKYRKISIKNLTTEQLRLLISQKIGIEYLAEIAIEKLELNILAEGDLYEGDLLEAVLDLPTEFWNEKPVEFQTFQNLIKRNSELIKTELGEKKSDRINEKIKTSAQQCL
ncbi:contact-dependent growth inhibition system immunity protein [Winogradskyella sp.]|uniref:contact-dependent growth inhibition system immunity protein n=1 Tax=Winogradskyella sp. TaxID=1883156 RepID=UPI00261C362A|nr:contact-dependent growth inhibition system immunity protein [Winogradskyella sp.]